MADRLYKFLRRGRIARFSGLVWPLDEWVKVEAPLVPCVNGIHVCRPADLPYWLSDELWEVEVAGEPIPAAQKLVVERARLRARVERWPTIARAFATDCARRAQELAVRELERLGQPEADELAACRNLPELKAVAERALRRRRPDRPVAAAEFIGFAVDAAEYASGRATTAARYVSYVAAHAAEKATPERRLKPGESRFALERDRQAAVLGELGL
jgi:hypothetical protein